jgi:hypothetical protein
MDVEKEENYIHHLLHPKSFRNLLIKILKVENEKKYIQIWRNRLFLTSEIIQNLIIKILDVEKGKEIHHLLQRLVPELGAT